MCAVLVPSLQYTARWSVDISPIAAQIRSAECWSVNMCNSNYIVYGRDHSSHCVNWRLCTVLAPSLQHNAHWIVDISPIGAALRLVEYWSLNMRNSNYIVYGRNHISHCVNCRLCTILAPRLQYKAHWIVDISPILAELRFVEYWSLNMRKSNYIVCTRDHSSHRVNCLVCAIYGTTFAVWSALNCRDISDSSADTSSWILKPQHAEL
jgi:hypothetical protein